MGLQWLPQALSVWLRSAAGLSEARSVKGHGRRLVNIERSLFRLW